MTPDLSAHQAGGAVDWTVLDDLARDMEDDTIAAELVAIYLAELPARRDALASAREAHDTDAMRAAAHALKAASATVGAIALADRCRLVESAAAQHDTGTAESEIAHALVSCDAVDAALRAGR